MRKNGYGRVVNLSSGAGQLDDMFGGRPAYRLSKVMLNAITRIFSYELKDEPVLVNTMCPGFVDTDLVKAFPSTNKITPEEGAKTAIWLATLPADGPRGKFFRKMTPIPW
eukprot:TRINITY_DN4071_c0_g1_i8.p1 TRINITY_DN4071_c0_g1~~TRINITY_DN4071_c0_g1_i8.p1  ORF type:complete len:110 (+),score=9.90 TRINITY_DN4071_c0_g1_i8:440-769(+)